MNDHIPLLLEEGLGEERAFGWFRDPTPLGGGITLCYTLPIIRMSIFDLKGGDMK
jgi:hypothetical protein